MADPTIYLAATGAHCGAPDRPLTNIRPERPPALLVSYAYLSRWVDPANRAQVNYRHWCMDSGAYTAWTKGKEVSFDAYTGYCKDQLASDPTLREVIALDVIENWRASRRNVERMWQQGVPAIPVYHLGEPEDVWVGYCRDYPKVCLGGIYLLKGREAKRRYVEQAFARAWPVAVHALAVNQFQDLMLGPFHSCDSSSWSRGPGGFGTWRGYSGVRGMKWQRLRSKGNDFQVEVDWYLRQEALLGHRWHKEMAEVAARLRGAGWRGYEGEVA